MTVKELKNAIKDLPDDTPVLFDDKRGMYAETFLEHKIGKVIYNTKYNDYELVNWHNNFNADKESIISALLLSKDS